MVRFHDGRWLMWYAGYLEGSREARVGIAESPDGITWTKARVGRFAFRGSLDNNICYPLQVPPYESQYAMPQTVVIDDDAPPERRFMLFVHAQGTVCVIGIAYSADGRSFVRDPSGVRYRADLPGPAIVGRLHQRTAVVHRDGWWWAFFGVIDRTAGRIQLETWMTGWPDETTDGANPSLGAWRAHPMLKPAAGRWDGTFTWPTAVVEHAGRLRLYYTGSQGAFAGAIGLATAPVDRLHWLAAADGRRCVVTSRPLGVGDAGGDPILEVNAALRGGGLRCALVRPDGASIRGFELEDFVGLERGSTWRRAMWRPTTGASAGPGAISVRIELTGAARLHAIRMRSGS